MVFGDRPLPRPLTGLPTLAVDDAPGPFERLIVVGADADLAAVLSRLLRADRLDVEVGYAPRRRTFATRAYRAPAGRRAARRARRGVASRVPLIRDETGTVLVGRGSWLPADGRAVIHGEAVVDDTVLFDGDAAGADIEPTLSLPGLRVALRDGRPWRRWVLGRAAQLGTTGASVMRDGVPAPRTVRRSTFYRNVEGWLLVR
ncbi:peptidase M50 [Mycobacterium intermedium]|uniref:Peptidase M50 n=1 Tax=Mycobacterium intermedium TaxID=28445 RepID=A0A1X0FME8_MYCIE|nr:peptidase M50 [Mycobacterium intermedium]